MSASAEKRKAGQDRALATPPDFAELFAKRLAAQERHKRQSLARKRHWPKNERELTPGWYPPPLIDEAGG